VFRPGGGQACEGSAAQDRARRAAAQQEVIVRQRRPLPASSVSRCASRAPLGGARSPRVPKPEAKAWRDSLQTAGV
jgi:hypothetical protein